jgi:hypothetical protein
MSRIAKFLQLEPPSRKLLTRTALLLWTIRISLWILPFPSLRRLLLRIRNRKPANHPPYTQQEIVWAVETASRAVVRPTCLVRALAADILLAREGYNSTINVGMTKRDDTLDAHAWVECDGAVLVGGFELERYKTLFTPIDWYGR